MAYEVLLLVLYRLLARIDETDEEVLLLAEVAIGIMRDVMSPIAGALSTLPIGPEAPGLLAAPTFELFYQPDYLLPHHRAAWFLYAERLRGAGQVAGRLAPSVPALADISATFHRFAGRLAD